MHLKFACIQTVSPFPPSRQRFFLRKSKETKISERVQTGNTLKPALQGQKTDGWSFPSIRNKGDQNSESK